MDHHEDAAELEHVEGDIPTELKLLTDEELKADFWDSPTCRSCLSYFHPELVGPAHNEAQPQAIDVPQGGVALHNSPTDLADGISQGCWWCARLFSKLQEECGTMTIEDFLQRYPTFHSRIYHGNEVSTYRLECSSDNTPALYMWLYRRDWARSAGRYFIDKNRVDAGSVQPTDYLPSCMYQLSDVGGNTGSHRSMQYIATQIRNCKKSHDSCGRLSNSTWYPRRLLQILSSGDDKITALRIVETRDDKTVNGPYATLSYCWGGKLNLRLLTTNYEKFHNTGIPAADVPQLFLDAAFVALRMGASYIWIDALCIIQNSKDDWLQESVTMHRVYQDGLCNIMAASAAHSGERLFRTRDPKLTAPCIIRDNNYRKISTYSEHSDLQETYRWFRNLVFEPLYQRGWVLQERLLATRNIIFTQDNVFFQCRHGATRDVFPHQVFTKTDSLTSTRTLSRENCFAAWRNIVTLYGRTTLSKPGDTLIAVSGLAEKIKEVYSNRYRYGLWEADLFQDLAWMDIRRERQLGFSAPSWSWASVRRPYYTQTNRGLDGVLKALAMASEDKLQLQGPMFSVSTDTPSSPFDADRIRDVIRRRMGLPSSGCPSPPMTQLDGSDAEREERPLPGTLLCLPLAYESKSMFYGGILLAPVTAAWGVYRRVGYFQINFENNAKHFDLRQDSTLDFSVGEDGTGRGGDGMSEARGDAECYPERLWALCMRRPGDIHYHEYDEVTKLHTIFLV